MTLRQPYIVGDVDGRLLVPADHEARAQLDQIPPGEVVEVVIYRERDPRFNALVYKTFSLVGNAMQWRARNVRGWLATKTGRSDLVRWPHDNSPPLLVPHGTGPADMNQTELEVFWDDAREVIRRKVLPYVDAGVAEEIGWRIDDLRNWQ